MTEPSASHTDRLGRRIAVVGLAVAVLAALGAIGSGLGSWLGLWRFGTGFGVLTWSTGCAVLGVVLSLIALLRRRRSMRRATLVPALLGLALGAAVTGYPLSILHTARAVPPIHDITTDTVDPPAFVAVLPLRRDAPNPATYGGPAIARQQQAAYPDIKPARFNAAPARVFAAALDTAKALGWEIVAAAPAEGRIEGTATTFWYHFKDDVVIRIRPEGDGTRLDIRSESRVGRSDIGTNARRIEQFLAALRTRMGSP
jgi:uncharacterized protein (DUF1499 family)